MRELASWEDALALSSTAFSSLMLRCLLALLGLFACSSALVVPAAPLVRSVATPARSSCPSMELAHRKGHVPRIEIEIEQGEP